MLLEYVGHPKKYADVIRINFFRFFPLLTSLEKFFGAMENRNYNL
jgi:hypothetical protein